jgi:hypothetical protein
MELLLNCVENITQILDNAMYPTIDRICYFLLKVILLVSDAYSLHLCAKIIDNPKNGSQQCLVADGAV